MDALLTTTLKRLMDVPPDDLESGVPQPAVAPRPCVAGYDPEPVGSSAEDNNEASASTDCAKLLAALGDGRDLTRKDARGPNPPRNPESATEVHRSVDKLAGGAVELAPKPGRSTSTAPCV